MLLLVLQGQFPFKNIIYSVILLWTCILTEVLDFLFRQISYKKVEILVYQQF